MELSLSSLVKRIRAWCPKVTLGRLKTHDSLQVLSDASGTELLQPRIAISSFLLLALGGLWASGVIGAMGISEAFSGKAVDAGLLLVSSALLLFAVFLSWTLHREASSSRVPRIEYLAFLTLGYYSIYTLADEFRAFRQIFGFQISGDVPLVAGLLEMLGSALFIIFGFTLLEISKTLLSRGADPVSPITGSLCMWSFGLGGLLHAMSSTSLLIIGARWSRPIDSLYNLAWVLDIVGASIVHIPFTFLGVQVHAKKILEKRVILLGAAFIASGWLTSNGSQVLSDIAARFLYRTSLLPLDDLLWTLLLVAVSLLSLVLIVRHIRTQTFSHIDRKLAIAAIFLYAAAYLGGVLLDLTRYRGWYVVGLLSLPYIIPLAAAGVLIWKTPTSQTPNQTRQAHGNGMTSS